MLAASLGVIVGVALSQYTPSQPPQRSGGQIISNRMFITYEIDKAVDISELEQILESRPEVANEFTAGGESPLHRAVGHSRPDIVQLLMQYDANISYRPWSPSLMKGTTALEFAARTGRLTSIREMLDSYTQDLQNAAFAAVESDQLGAAELIDGYLVH